jgi:hypothetical protein
VLCEILGAGRSCYLIPRLDLTFLICVVLDPIDRSNGMLYMHSAHIAQTELTLECLRFFGAVAVTGPGAWYLLQPGPDGHGADHHGAEHADHGDKDEHSEHDEQSESETDGESENAEDSKTPEGSKDGDDKDQSTVRLLFFRPAIFTFSSVFSFGWRCDLYLHLPMMTTGTADMPFISQSESGSDESSEEESKKGESSPESSEQSKDE